MVREWLDSWHDRLSSLASRLESALAAKCSVWSHSLGECTTYDGHTLGLECALAGSTPEKPQVLVLEFRIRAMTSQPFMEKATLAWTDWEARQFKTPLPTPKPVDAALLAKLDASFPKLELVIRKAVARGPRERKNGVSVSVEMDRESEPEGPFDQANATELELVQAGFQSLFGRMIGEPVVLSPWMSFRIAQVLQGPPADFPDCRQDTWEDFQRRNLDTVTFPENFQLGERATVLYRDSPDVGFEARDFFRQFPRSPGIIHFSRPGFSADGSQALLVAFRNDDLASESRPQNHPTDSAHFHQLCFYQRRAGDWKLVGFTDWTKLVNHEQFMARGERARKKHLEAQLLAGGWRIVESEPERLRLTGLSESSVTVVTDRYLMRRLNEIERDPYNSRFYICPDPVLIVPWIDAAKILEKLK